MSASFFHRNDSISAGGAGRPILAAGTASRGTAEGPGGVRSHARTANNGCNCGGGGTIARGGDGARKVSSSVPISDLIIIWSALSVGNAGGCGVGKFVFQRSWSNGYSKFE